MKLNMNFQKGGVQSKDPSVRVPWISLGKMLSWPMCLRISRWEKAAIFPHTSY